MAVKASATITLTQYRDTQSVTRYYKLQPAGSSTPLKPETKPPSSDWTDSEPACDISKELYFCDLTIFSNGEGEYSAVSKSTSYEAAKQAYNRAQAAKDSIDNLEIGGRNLFIDSQKMAGYLGSGQTYGNLSAQNSVNKEWTSQDISCSEGDSFVLQVWRTVPESVTSQPYWRAYQCYANDNSLVGGRPAWDSNATIDSNGVAYSIDIITIPKGASKFRFSARLYSDGFVKLEKGNKATDWTPAPEDVDAGINNAAKTATSYITDINENSGIKVRTKNNANNYVQVNSNGMSVYQDINNSAVQVASLGANGIVLGIDKNAQTIVTADGIKIANASGIVGVSVDSSGTTEVATKVVNVYTSIRQGSQYTLTLDSSIASGTSVEFRVELDGFPEFGEWFTITVGTNKSGTFSGNVQFSYVYNATNKQITITANNNDSVVLCYYRYDVTSDLPLVQLNGVLEFNGEQQKDIKIEVGTSGNWTYEKWSSGIVKMYYNGTYSSAFNNGNYFGAHRGTGQILTYPFTLTSVIYANVDHIAPNTGFCVLSTYDTTQLKFYPYNRTNLKETQTSIKVIAEVVGRWK